MVDYTKPIAESNNFIILEKYTKDGQVAEGYQSEGDLERELIQDLVNHLTSTVHPAQIVHSPINTRG